MATEQNILVLDGSKLEAIPIPYDKCIKRGCETFFFPISRQRGLKVFLERKNALFSFKRQSKASEHKLAPKVYGKGIFKIILPMGFEQLGKGQKSIYDAPLDTDLLSFFRNDPILYGYYTQRAKMDRVEITSDMRESLSESLNKIFPRERHDDCHLANVGWVGKRLVMVDFGNAGISKR